MSSFTTRVELVNPDHNDYELLHQEMRDAQFYRSISYCGKWKDLPFAEYDHTSNQTVSQAYDAAFAAVTTVINNKPISDKQQKKDFFLLVSEASARVFKLPDTTEIAKLPPGASL